MSIGNLKDSGNQGNNFPWQLKMLLGQQCACDQLTAIAGNTDDLEFILTAILTTLQAGTEYEAKFVLETCDGEPPTTRVLLEVRVWNTDTGTWEPPTYYLPGSTTPIVPTPPDAGCTLEYTDPSGALAMIYNELQTQTTILTDIEGDTTSIDTTLTNLFAAYSAGQQACADSLSVTLCTEQGTALSNIETSVDNIDTTTGNLLTEALSQGITLDNIETLITALNGLVATEVTLSQILTELQAINIDTNGLSQESTQLLVLAAINTVISNTTGLATEVTLNALLTAFNAEDFATETTLAALNLWVQGNAATEATLQAVLLELQGINIDTNGLSQEATQLLVLAAINTVISNTTGLATEVTLNALLTAFNAEDFATETTLAALNLWVQGNAATETTLQSVLVELQGINIDTNGLSQEATQLLVLAALNNILTDTTNLDVPLSTVATEVTLQAVLAAINNLASAGLATEATLLALFNAFTAEDFATETTLALIEAITSQMTFTGGDLNVSANMQVGDVDVSAANPVPVVLPTGTQTTDIQTYTGIQAAFGTPVGATSFSIFNEGSGQWELAPALAGPWTILSAGVSIDYVAQPGKTLSQIFVRKLTLGGKLIITSVV